MKACMILFLACFFSMDSFSQGVPVFRVKIKFEVEEGGYKNSLITITRDGKPYRVIDPDKGKYFVDLELGSEFKLTFTKPGHVTKSIIIDTHVPNGRENSEFAGFDAAVELNLQPPDQIITYSQPVGRIKYSNASGDFDFDHDYTSTAQAQQKKDEANAKPKPKEPPPKPVSNPEPVVIKQPEHTPEPEKPKPVVKEPEIVYKPVVTEKEERIIQKDRLRITIIIVTINGTPYEYKKEEYAWGGVYFYRNGQNITEGTFNNDTD